MCSSIAIPYSASLPINHHIIEYSTNSFRLNKWNRYGLAYEKLHRFECAEEVIRIHSNSIAFVDDCLFRQSFHRPLLPVRYDSRRLLRNSERSGIVIISPLIPRHKSNLCRSIRSLFLDIDSLWIVLDLGTEVKQSKLATILLHKTWSVLKRNQNLPSNSLNSTIIISCYYPN